MVGPSTRSVSGSSSRPARMIVMNTTRTRAVRSSAARSDDSDCSESRTSMRHSNARWNDGLPRAAGSRWIARRWRRSCAVSRGTHVKRKLSEGVCDSSVAKSDVPRILESTNKPRSVSEQCSCLVAVRDEQRTERQQPDTKGSEGRGELPSRRFGCHQTCESVLW